MKSYFEPQKMGISTSNRRSHGRVLHIGAGLHKIKGATTLDINPLLLPDVVWDLNVFPYPFGNSEFDTVVCEHVLEHLQNVIGVMEELHRVTKPAGRVVVRVPYFSSINFMTDPTHVHSFSSRTFNYMCIGEAESRYGYSTVQFRKLVARMAMRPEKELGNRLAVGFMNRFLGFYEEHLAYILPGQELLFVLEVVK